MVRSSLINLNDMTTHDSSIFASQIQERLQGLNPERLNFFIRWLEDHTTLIELNAEAQRQISLSTWFEKLPAAKAQEEYRLMIAEIIWCTDTPLPELRRIASSEVRRSFDE